jgi:hypothetical protein
VIVQIARIVSVSVESLKGAMLPPVTLNNAPASVDPDIWAAKRYQ